MDKNQAIGIGLMIAVVLVWTIFFGPEETEPTTEETTTEQVEDSTSQVSENTAVVDQNTTEITSTESTPDSAAQASINQELVSRYGVFAGAAQGEGEMVVIENNRIRAELNTRGGMFERVTLQDGYRTYWDSTNIELWDPALSAMGLEVNYRGKGKIQSTDLFFSPSTAHAQASEGNSAVLTMKLPGDQPGKYIEITYTLPHDSYEMNCSVNLVGLQNEIDLAQPTQLHWSAAALHQEKGIDIERQRSSVFFRYNEMDRDYLGENREDSEELEEPLNWMAFKQNYFTAAVISDSGFPAGGFIESKPPVDENDTLHTMTYDASLYLDAASGTVPLRFFFGPNDYEVLKNTDVPEFHRIIDYGWWIFGWVNRNFIRPVFSWLSSFIGSAGIVILILTLMIKLLLFPITWKNYLSSAKMRVLKPEVDEINKKYEGKDAMEKQQATMALYRQTGVNPLAGCLPMLLQLPILYAMFRFFPASIELRGKGFLWAEDLGSYDQIISWSTEIPFLSSVYGNHVSGFTLLMAISTFFYTRMNSANMPTQSQPGMPNMKVIMNIFPFMMLIFFNKFAAGLSFYYFAANLVSIAQMYSIKRWFIDEDKIHAKIQANKTKPRKKSAFQQRLEEAQKLQKEQQKNRKNRKK